ncbi:MAG: aminotransferase class I/II-fold pyridoxal phosphate-dependent enzyme [Bacteroidota bacterium]
MLHRSDFRPNAEKMIDWIDQFYKNLESFPVKSQVKPKDILNQLPESMPHRSETIDAIMADLDTIILPGITHWQHPNYHAYFPANTSVESVIAEFATAAIGAQCMIWDTSPAAAELEERMMEWLRQAMGMPDNFEGVIQDTASTATLAAILTAREVCTDFRSNIDGVPNNLRVYCSTETHSSIEKAVAISGIGTKNLIKIPVDEQLRLDPGQLEAQIKADQAIGLNPCCVIVALGTTGTVAVDDIEAIGKICEQHQVWLHIDAAYAGTALLLPEYQYMIRGMERSDSFVFNPHKWMFTNFDCTAYFVKDVDALIKTFEVLPEYLKTNTRGQVNDYRDWGIPLGRRFRALKLWFLMRSYGLEGLQAKLRHHIELNTYFAEQIRAMDSFELLIEPILNFTCFRKISDPNLSEEHLCQENAELLDRINSSGKAFLSHTKVHGKYAIRIVIGQTYVEKRHVDLVLGLLKG